MELRHPGLVTPRPETDSHGQQLDCPSLPLSAAQLDSIGFSIIRKCIHAVETRGKAVQHGALFSARGTHLWKPQTCYLLFSDFKWLINSPSAIADVCPRAVLLWNGGSWSIYVISLFGWSKKNFVCVHTKYMGFIRKPVTEVQLLKYKT